MCVFVRLHVLFALRCNGNIVIFIPLSQDKTSHKGEQRLCKKDEVKLNDRFPLNKVKLGVIHICKRTCMYVRISIGVVGADKVKAAYAHWNPDNVSS